MAANGGWERVGAATGGGERPGGDPRPVRGPGARWDVHGFPACGPCRGYLDRLDSNRPATSMAYLGWVSAVAGMAPRRDLALRGQRLLLADGRLRPRRAGTLASVGARPEHRADPASGYGSPDVIGHHPSGPV